MMRRILFITILAVVSCLFPLLAMAQEEIKPEDNVPGWLDNVPGWLTESPYQRNVYLDFAKDPSTKTGPIPGAVYGGLADKDLWDDDNFSYDGDIIVQSGAIGIPGGGSGTINMGLGNLPISNPVKRIYVEGDVGLTDISDIINIRDRIYASYKLPTNHKVVDSGYDVENEDWINLTATIYFWAEIRPNPPWEEAELIFEGIQGTAWIGEVHIVTECVPDSECISDTDSDGVVDGADLAEFMATDLYISVKKFAAQFGKPDC